MDSVAFILQEVIRVLMNRWELVVFIVVLIFNSGVMFSVMKNKPSENRVYEMIDERFENHCPFTSRIKNLEDETKESVEYKQKLALNLHKESEYVHLSLQRVELNLKRVCEKLEIDYLT